MEDPDQIDESQLEKIIPHDIIRCLIEVFRNNQLKADQEENDEGDSNVLLK